MKYKMLGIYTVSSVALTALGVIWLNASDSRDFNFGPASLIMFGATGMVGSLIVIVATIIGNRQRSE